MLSFLLSSVGCGGEARRLWNRRLSLVSALPSGQGTLRVLPPPCASISSSVTENTDSSGSLDRELSRGNELIQGKLLGQHLPSSSGPKPRSHPRLLSLTQQQRLPLKVAAEFDHFWTLIMSACIFKIVSSLTHCFGPCLHTMHCLHSTQCHLLAN